MKLSNIVVGKSRLLVAVAFCFLIVFGGCKKDKKNESPAEPELPPGQETTATKAELLADSLFLYAKEVYLWNSDLPTYEVFNPRKYVSVDEEAGLSKELFEITRYARDNYEYKPSDPTDTKYSYIFDTDDTNPIAYLPARKSSVDLEGNGYDFGVWVGLYGNNTLYEVRILTVSKGSPADLAGIKRGDVITGINNRQFGSNYTSGDADYINTNLLGDQQTVTLTYKRGSGAAHTTTLSRASYKSNPVYCDSVYTAGQKKIGYIAFARFSNLSNAQSVLDKAFSRFSATAVTDLIVDLRYNGGGYVSTSEYLADLIAPATLNGKIMYKEFFNKLLQDGKATLLKKQPSLDAYGNVRYTNGRVRTYADEDYSVDANTFNFAKRGNLNSVERIVFLVSGNTASASELLINSLKAHVDVKLVGEQTYGKPVGFFPIRIGKYEVYYSMFESKNAKDEGGYFKGMSPDYTVEDQGIRDFGDLREDLLASAYNYLVGGSFTSAIAKTASVAPTGSQSSTRVIGFSTTNKEFKGMVEDRK